MTGLHDSIEFSMMEAGHTKFSPDWHFGLWKVSVACNGELIERWLLILLEKKTASNITFLVFLFYITYAHGKIL